MPRSEATSADLVNKISVISQSLWCIQEFCWREGTNCASCPILYLYILLFLSPWREQKLSEGLPGVHQSLAILGNVFPMSPRLHKWSVSWIANKHARHRALPFADITMCLVPVVQASICLQEVGFHKYLQTRSSGTLSNIFTNKFEGYLTKKGKKVFIPVTSRGDN
jgi:hypothetical protein